MGTSAGRLSLDASTSGDLLGGYLRWTGLGSLDLAMKTRQL
jgi:hypothetical protein